MPNQAAYSPSRRAHQHGSRKRLGQTQSRQETARNPQHAFVEPRPDTPAPVCNTLIDVNHIFMKFQVLTTNQEPSYNGPTADQEPSYNGPTADQEPSENCPTADQEPSENCPIADQEPSDNGPTTAG
jgi:hypothetical protein